jgi:hypothetical protein
MDTIQQLKQARSTKPFPDILLVALSSGKADFGATQELLQRMHELHLDLAKQSPD